MKTYRNGWIHCRISWISWRWIFVRWIFTLRPWRFMMLLVLWRDIHISHFICILWLKLLSIFLFCIRLKFCSFCLPLILMSKINYYYHTFVLWRFLLFLWNYYLLTGAISLTGFLWFSRFSLVSFKFSSEWACYPKFTRPSNQLPLNVTRAA